MISPYNPAGAAELEYESGVDLATGSLQGARSSRLTHNPEVAGSLAQSNRTGESSPRYLNAKPRHLSLGFDSLNGIVDSQTPAKFPRFIVCT